MRKFAAQACVVALLIGAGCGSNNGTQDAGVQDAGVEDAGGQDAGTRDAGTDGGAQACDPIEQTGCGSGQKCTWIFSSADAGAAGCEPNGSVALGGACAFGPAQYPEFDNCEAGDICVAGTCKAICGTGIDAGTGACAIDHACFDDPPLFTSNGSTTAGACSKLCDPLADNSFGARDGGDSIPPRTGTTCAANEGCYGFPSAVTGQTTQFVCAPEANPGLVHRSDCNTTDGCAPNDISVYVNGCAQGYLPLEYTAPNGLDIQICAALCQPQDCYSGHCGADNLASVGTGSHQCDSADVRTESGTHGSAYVFPTAATGGDATANSCYYWWSTEYDSLGTLHSSTFDNTLGICLDHSKYFFDPTGGQNPTTPWPDCAALPGSGTSGPGGSNAADWACISTTTAAALGDKAPGERKRNPIVPRLRLAPGGIEVLKQLREARQPRP